MSTPYPFAIPESIAESLPTTRPPWERHYDGNAREMTNSPHYFACLSSLIGCDLWSLADCIRGAGRELAGLRRESWWDDERWQRKTNKSEATLNVLVNHLEYLVADLDTLKSWGLRTLAYDPKMQAKVIRALAWGGTEAESLSLLFGTIHAALSAVREQVQRSGDPRAEGLLEALEVGCLAPMSRLRAHLGVPYESGSD